MTLIDSYTGNAGANGSFSYSGGGTFPVYVVSYSYSWSLETKGSSQARQRQTIYPFRRSQSDINVTLQFPTRERMREFADWCRTYHLAVTSSSGIVGENGVPDMVFTLNIPSRTYEMSGQPYSYNGRSFTYNVLMPSINVVQSNESIAPTMRLTLRIVGGGDYEKDVATSWTSGSVTESIMNNRVTANSVKSNGDAAYGSATVNGQGLTRGGH